MSETSVAVIGLGKMGVPIAERILDAGHPARRLEPDALTRGVAGVPWRDGARRAGRRAGRGRVCVTMLTDDDALEAVAPQVLAGARPGTTLVDMSTVSVAASERVAERADEAGVDFLRSPVSGNPTVVRGGTLTLVVSGPRKRRGGSTACCARSAPRCSTSARASAPAS